MKGPILLVEDSVEDAQAVQRVFRDTGVWNPIHVLQDGSEAIAYLRGDGIFSNRQQYPAPAVLMLDLKLPGIDGFEILEWISQRPHLRQSLLIIVLSGDNQLRNVNRAYALGAHSFLVKPCNRADVLNLVSVFTGYWEHEPMRMEPIIGIQGENQTRVET